jgi:hypothetical protein
MREGVAAGFCTYPSFANVVPDTCKRRRIEEASAQIVLEDRKYGLQGVPRDVAGSPREAFDGDKKRIIEPLPRGK